MLALDATWVELSPHYYGPYKLDLIFTRIRFKNYDKLDGYNIVSRCIIETCDIYHNVYRVELAGELYCNDVINHIAEKSKYSPIIKLATKLQHDLFEEALQLKEALELKVAAKVKLKSLKIQATVKTAIKCYSQIMTSYEYKLLQAILREYFRSLTDEQLQALYKSGWDGICELLGIKEGD